MLPSLVNIQQTGKKINLKSAKQRPWFGGWQTFLGVIKFTKNDVKLQSTQHFKNTKCVINWTYIPDVQKDNKKTFLIFPGLTGDYNANYVVDTIKTIRKYNYKIGVYRYSFLSNTVKQGRIRVMDEVEEVLKQLKAQQPDRQIECVGFSNGANQILHYVGKSAEQCVVSKLMIVSCPFDLVKASQDISLNATSLLSLLAVKNVKPLKDKFIGYQLNWDSICKSRTLYEFDDRFSRIICDYPSVDAYYQDTSSSKYIDQIYIPVLALHSKDDSFCPITAVPTTSQRISFILTSTGGHNAFVTWRFKYWFNQPLEEFFSTPNEKLYFNS